ncbi:thioredoxin fold domain-containing protein [Aliifodinibius salicampi]|uniref:Thioredoxin fold domain-containing protein n=1 Tax=Fodinibius salicampi TaxID=1920655 RepID=A0ABT3PZD8_9BACT|nr:thioredoxin fold domain-containing protein [Fodinibius salicampi]MCW9713235.1 thioredoxin fold domain-containing protein [Fodinibius salicampi]
MISTKTHLWFKCLLAALLLAGWHLPATAQSNAEVEWQPFETAIEIADSSNRPILIHVWAPWCGWCQKMEREVYPRLTPELSDHFIITRLNRGDHETTHQYKGQKLTSFRLAQKLTAESVPTIIFLSSNGDYLLRLPGFIEADNLHPVLKYISSNAYVQHSFEAFNKRRKEF